MKRQARIFGTAALTLALAACSHQPSVKQQLAAPIDKTMDCPQIDLTIDRADTVRWLIRDEGGKLETKWDRGSRSVANVILVPLGLLGGTFLFVGDGGHAVLDAADGRIRELLQLKRAHRCPPRATALPGMDDLALLHELESVQARINGGSGEEAGFLKERTRLLDGLRIVPAPVAAP